MSLALAVQSLACLRGQRLLFRDVGFRVAPGEVLALEGPNGVGKTSLLRQLAGFLAADAGTITLEQDGRAIAEPEERGRCIGWLGHQDGLKSQLSARENLAFFARLYSSPADIDNALSQVGLARAADLPAQYLSAGQKRRLALARLLISARPLWLLDEPLAALDAQGKTLVNAALKTHAAGGGIAVAATHEALDAATARFTLGAA